MRPSLAHKWPLIKEASRTVWLASLLIWKHFVGAKVILTNGYAYQYLIQGVIAMTSDLPIEDRVAKAACLMAPLGSFANDGGLGTKVYNIVSRLKFEESRNEAAEELCQLLVDCASNLTEKPR